MSNAINVISPYMWRGMWVFDDDRVGLEKEPFVTSAGAIIEGLLKKSKIRNPERGFNCLFSMTPFPECDVLEWIRFECSGDIYSWNGLEGWLCPALRKYYPDAPEKIYIKVQKKK